MILIDKKKARSGKIGRNRQTLKNEKKIIIVFMKMVSMDSVIFMEIKEENYKIKIFIVYFFNI